MQFADSQWSYNDDVFARPRRAGQVRVTRVRFADGGNARARMPRVRRLSEAEVELATAALLHAARAPTSRSTAHSERELYDATCHLRRAAVFVLETEARERNTHAWCVVRERKRIRAPHDLEAAALGVVGGRSHAAWPRCIAGALLRAAWCSSAPAGGCT